MKALILAAGLGTRLRPITDKTPKPLVLIGDKPLLWYHLESLRKGGINEILINTHYLPQKINDFIFEYMAIHPEIEIVTAYEKDLLGSAGTLKKNAKFFCGEHDILIVYGDNLTAIDYNRLLEFHLRHQALVTIASYYEKNPESKGIIVYDESKKVSGFVEKPKPDEIVSHQANGGIYVLSNRIFSYLDEMDSSVIDFGRDLFPFILDRGGDIFTYEMDEFLMDIGTIENYKSAQEQIRRIKF